MQVTNKRNRVPQWLDFIPELELPVNVRQNGSSIALEPNDHLHREDFESFLLRSKRFLLWSVLPGKLDKRLMSRFLGKVAIEALAKRLSGTKGWREELLSQDALEPLRRYVRIGNQKETWRFNRRRLYRPHQSFGSDEAHYQILHEYDFLYTQDCKLIFVIALFGEEFAINMGGSDTERYKEYLQEKQRVSLLAPWG